MRIFAADNQAVYVLYRAATERVHRDMYLLRSTDGAATFQEEDVGSWDTVSCPMSTAFFIPCSKGTLAAWETKGQVYSTLFDAGTGKSSPPVAAPGDARDRKYPVLACNSKGETMLVWTEGMGWNKGGSVAWQIYGKDGQPTGPSGKREGVPTWSLVGVFARPDGNFAIVY
jgi:hypothetical protein